MKKVYKFNLIPGVEFVEDDGFYYAASDDLILPKSHITKVIIDGLLEYEKNNKTLYRELTFAKETIGDRDKTIKEKDKAIKTHKNVNSRLNNRIEYIKKCAENEIGHRNKLLDEKDEEIKTHKNAVSVLQGLIAFTKETAENERKHRDDLIKEKDKEIEYLREENTKLNKQLAQRPITKSPVPLSSAEDCSGFYVCTPDHIAYGPIAGGFGIGLYVDDTLILLKGDKASEVVRERSSMTDRINTLEATLKKKDETIKKLRNTVEFESNICDSYVWITKKLTDIINENNSEIKVLSDQVTRLMDQLKEAMKENSGCESCVNGPEPCCDICGNTDCEHRVETEGKPETNLDKVLHDMFISALDIWLKENTDTNQRLEENIKED